MQDAYRLEIARSARKRVQHIGRPFRRRVVEAIARLGHDPRPHGYRELRGQKGLYRVRCGQYRIIYEIDDVRRVVFVRRVGDRGEKELYS